MPPRGRLLHHPGDALWNMSLDDALLQIASEGPADQSVTLRIYRWCSPALTIGRFQDVPTTIDLARRRDLKLPVVRRPTGGRAVYHSTDLTFSLVFSEARLGLSSVTRLAQFTSQAISAALLQIGWNSTTGTHRAAGAGSPADCFALAAPPDLASGGRKVLGAASLRSRGYVLQQCSLRLWPIEIPEGVLKASRTAAGFRWDGRLTPPDREAGSRSGKPANFFSDSGSDAALGYSVSRALAGNHDTIASANATSRAEAAIMTALAEAFGLTWEAAQCTSPERQRAMLLLRERYGRDEWNLDGKEIRCRSDS